MNTRAVIGAEHQVIVIFRETILLRFRSVAAVELGGAGSVTSDLKTERFQLLML